MSDNTDYAALWYHGSPQEMTILRAGSWVTPFKELAKAFSHKPATISASDDFLQVTHDGELPGFLYRIAESIAPEDIAVLPGTKKTHWRTLRDLNVERVRHCRSPILPASRRMSWKR
jgi:hypothetical protein